MADGGLKSNRWLGRRPLSSRGAAGSAASKLADEFRAHLKLQSLEPGRCTATGGM